MKKRTLSVALVVALVAIVVIGGTLAYFTDTEVADNTFVVGDIDIDLGETPVDVYGESVIGESVSGNEYKMVPNHNYTKDPTTTVNKDSEPCYVRNKVQVVGLAKLMELIPKTTYPEYYEGDLFLLQKFVGGWEKSVWDTDWAYGFDAAKGTYEFRYIGPKSTNGVVDARNATVTLEPLFTDFTIPSFLDNDDIAALEAAGFEIIVTADAIQSMDFADAAAAWTAFDAK